MFTGLVEKVGNLKNRQKTGGGTTLTIEHLPWEQPLGIGESIAVNGICFTVTSRTESSFTCDALDETLARTNLNDKDISSPVNLERSLRVGDRIGGHFVSGHVDGTATVETLRDTGRDKVLRLTCDDEILYGMVPKGSVACDGVSLTVSLVGNTFFEVNIIPYTWNITAITCLKCGMRVNIETDMIGKYVLRAMNKGGGSHGIDPAQLKKSGFID